MEARIPSEFPFPFQPYEIQLQFMKNLYQTILDENNGIFESPTGTGKSLSISCGLLTWLRDYENETIQHLEDSIKILQNEIKSSDNNDNWLEEEYNKIQKTKELNKLVQKLELINKSKQEILHMRERVFNLKTKQCDEKHSQNCNYTKFLNKPKSNKAEECNEVDLIVNDCASICSSDGEESLIENNEETRIFPKFYFASRTHSQLTQFLSEIRKTSFRETTRVVTLASRQHYCINENVLRLKNINLINERCLDMQKNKSKGITKGDDGKAIKKIKTDSCASCPYFQQANIEKLKENILVEILDMEDILKTGKMLKACPYYATRAALKETEIVLLTHAGIVSAGARSAISLDLKNNVLIIDEAHGLISAVEQAHTATVNAKSLNNVKLQLHGYVEKYKTRFSSKNLLLLNQMLFVIKKLLSSIEVKSEPKSEIHTLENFVIIAEIDHLNMKPLIDFCKKTRLPQKLHGFCLWKLNHPEENTPKVETNKLNNFLSTISKKKTSTETEIVTNESSFKNEIVNESSAGSFFYIVLNFLEMLCNRSEDGRILVQSSNNLQGQLKYLLLNPAAQFSQVVQECRSVILAGGTMKPVEEFQKLLKVDSISKEVNLVFCDHVVPSENILAVCLSRGPSNKTFNFSFENRGSKELLDETCRAILNLCSIVPGGIICFLPSYNYEQTLCNHMKLTNTYEKIKKRKCIFHEPKGAGEAEKVLKDYANSVNNRQDGNTGALLLSVVGGKLSEGLNFSDDLGRCVIVVGLPYPNIKSLELQEKMKYLNNHVGPNEGNAYYESLCMKAVNQCIGRAIRHINDYACMVLMDERYSKAHISGALPNFVQKSLHNYSNFGQAFGSVAKFFAKKKIKSP